MTNTFTDWLKKEAEVYNNERKKTMNKKVKTNVSMGLNAKQKKALLDIFNAGNNFSQSYRESGIKYVTAWEIEQLLDLLDDMKDLFGISPKKSDEPDRDGDYYPYHWADHVWSDDPRAWKREND
jgi:molecular chaperone GrpE (heat shock protein)